MKMTVRTLMDDTRDNLPFGVFLVIVLAILGTLYHYREDKKNLSYELLQNISNNGTVILKVDKAKTIVNVMGDTEAIFGLSHKELMGMPVANLIDAEHQGRHQEYIDQIFESDQTAIISVVNDIKNTKLGVEQKYNIKCYYAEGHAWCIIDPYRLMVGA